MTRQYVIDGDGRPLFLCEDVMVWGEWFETASRVVARTVIGEVCISTIFLGLDHNWEPDGPPILWETIIFGGPHDQYEDRYSTLEDAVAGHARVVAFCRPKASVL